MPALRRLPVQTSVKIYFPSVERINIAYRQYLSTMESILKEKAKDALVVVITHENADLLSADKTIVMEKMK